MRRENLKPGGIPLLASLLIMGNPLLCKGNVNYHVEKTTFNGVDQKKAVSGTVLDVTGTPIVGANVVVKGTTNGTITDMDGKFSLDVEEGTTLVVSYIGFASQEILIGNQTKISISLKEDSESLEEVIVVGYGVQKKVNMTGSVAAIDSESLSNRPVTNVSTALQGMLPGVTVVQNSGQPGKDNSTIRIRGVGTLNNANPMYVVDGLIVSTINDIDPNDIESISVLKDAASAAIYGSRAANGVVLVTTKKGSKKAATLRYDGYVGWQSPTALPEYLPSHEYAELYNKALINEGKQPLYSDAEIELFRNGSDPDNYPNTDWLGLFYKDKGFQHSHRAEVSGGSETTSYMFSLGYLGQDGIVDNSDFQRYNLRGNINTTIGKFSAGVNFSYTYGNTNEPISSWTGDFYQILRQINRIAPFVPYKYSNGYYGYIADGSPMAWVESGSIHNQKYYTTRAVGNVGYEFIKGLKLQEVIGYEHTGDTDETFLKDIQYYNWKTGEPTQYQGPNSQTDDREDYMMLSLQTLLTYNNTFGKHTIGALAGFSQEYSRRDWTIGKRINFLNNDLWELNAGSPEGQTAQGSANEYALRSFFGRVTYDYDNKYLFEANIRRDGTSRIRRETRWGTFPSFSAAWRIINEPFMESTRDVLSDLKLRGGWGKLGNQQLGTDTRSYIEFYPYQSVLSQKNYAFGGTVNQGVAPVAGANSDLKWETSKTTNIGLDAGFLQNMFTISVDAYWKKTYDILMKLPVSTLYGLEAPYQNAGEVTNKGVEMQLGYKLSKNDFTFNVAANIAYNKNEVTNLHNDGAEIWLNSYSLRQEGLPINAFGGYEVLGIFTDEEDLANSAVINRDQAGLGDLKYKDQNNDGKIDGEDRVYLGSWDPAWTFGLNLNATWKGFDVSVMFQGAADVKGFLQNETVGRLQGNTAKPTDLFRDAWDAETNPDGKFPRPLTTWTQNDSESNPSDFWIINSSYLRMKNFQFGYTLPKSVCDFIRVPKIRVYYSGQNLLTFTGFSNGFDPEAPAGARAYYPQVKVNTFGLNITF